MTNDNQQRKLAIQIVKQASEKQRLLLAQWAEALLAVRNGPGTLAEKVRSAWSVTAESKAVIPLVKILGREVKRLGWDERGLPARIGLSAAAFAALLFSGKGAGIAALGGAIGVPLWVVFGAGGAFAGVLIEEITRASKEEEDSGRVIDGEVIKPNPANRSSGR